MTPKQIQQFNKMRAALIRIGKEYMTPEKIKRNSDRLYGLEYEESLEMSYENIQTLANNVVKGVKELKQQTNG